MMAVGGGAAVAGHVLEHRQHAARHQALARRAPPIAATLRGRVAVGAVADHRIGAATGTSATGRQSTSMPSAREIGGDQPRAEPRGCEARAPVAVVESRRRRRPADSAASAAARAAARGRPPDRPAPARRVRPPRANSADQAGDLVGRRRRCA